MLTFLFIFASSENQSICIDLGSQYIKMASIDSEQHAKIILNSHLKELTPFAAAYKELSSYFSDDSGISMEDNNFLIGDDAIKVLEQNPSAGFRYLGQGLGRSRVVLLNMHKKLRLDPQITFGQKSYTKLLSSFFNQFAEYHEPASSTCLVIPHFFSHSQATQAFYTFISTSLSSYIIHQNVSTVTDIAALQAIYVKMYPNRIQQGGRTVLFLDIGAFSSKAITMKFTDTIPRFSPKILGTAFSEIACIQNLIMEHNLSDPTKPIKPKKVLSKFTDPNSCGLNFTVEIVRIIQESIGNNQINEVQLLGGGAQLPCVELAARMTLTRDSPMIARDLPQFHALAIGGAYLCSMNPSPGHSFYRGHSIKLKAAGREIKYVTKGSLIVPSVVVPDIKSEIVMTIHDPKEVPYGVNPLINRYKILNFSLPEETADGWAGSFSVSSSYQELSGGVLCSTTRCRLAKLKNTNDLQAEIFTSLADAAVPQMVTPQQAERIRTERNFTQLLDILLDR